MEHGHQLFYNTDAKSEIERQALTPWNEKHIKKELTSNFQKEMLEQYKNDVRNPSETVIKFSGLIEEKAGGIQCFHQLCTFAAYVLECFRSLLEN